MSKLYQNFELDQEKIKELRLWWIGVPTNAKVIKLTNKVVVSRLVYEKAESQFGVDWTENNLIMI